MLRAIVLSVLLSVPSSLLIAQTSLTANASGTSS